MTHEKGWIPTLRRFISYYKPHKPLLAADMAASLFVALIGIVYPIVTRSMLNDLIPNKKYALIVLYGASLLALYAVRMFLNYFIQYYGHVMGVKMQAQMRTDMFRHLERLPYAFYDTHETGKIMSRMTNDLMDISELAHHGPENVLISGVSILVSFVYLATINVPLTCIVFACVPLLALISLRLRRRMRDAFAESKKSVAKINAALESSISGIRVTKAFNNAEKECEKFEVGNGEFVKARSDAYRAMGQFHSATSFVTDVFNVVVLIAGGLFLYAGSIDFGDYSAFILSVNLFINPVTTLINFMEQYQNGVTGFERFVEILDAEPERDAEGAEDAGTLAGDVVFDNVSCSYENGAEVLHGVSLHFEKGKKYALVGPSGGGKTTVCHLIPRFYDVSGGRILIDGVDTRRMTLASLRGNVGIVQQDVYLFNASVRDNILYGRPTATEEEVVAAAKRADIHEDVMKMEHGYDTVIGERGVKLSGGQKQRLSIARAFLKDPPILILDEATSSLDNATEASIQHALDELTVGRTTLTVAHRLSTVKDSDRIFVVLDGKIAESGTHDELVAAGGAYAELASGKRRGAPQ